MRLPRAILFRVVAAAALVLTAGSCAPVYRSVRDVLPGSTARLAGDVTIHRDEWGVPHIYGPTDASVVFGLAYAQAEDNFWQIEEDYIQALGRAAELYGEAALPADLVRAAFEVQRLAREEYEREPPERRRLWDAWARGLNYYLETRPNVRPRLLTRFEPWWVFTRFRSVGPRTVVDGVTIGEGIVPIAEQSGGGASAPDSARDWQAVATLDPSAAAFTEPDSDLGSNTWAIAPSRTEAGHALLFLNPHVRFFGSGQRYELHLHSEEGWHFSGFAILGTPIPRAGHNEHLGWSHTNTGADGADAFELTFDHPTDSLSYRYGDGWRQAVEWTAALRVRGDSGITSRAFRFRRSHHGPVVARGADKPIAVRIARFEEGGSLQQWYAMGRATSLETFRQALAAAALPISNTMYADRDGHIFYVHGNAVPRRSAAFDRTRPADGSDPRADWEGYHSLDELPQLLDPPSGWLQNTNSTPFRAAAEGENPATERFPAYMAPEPDNARARVSRRILSDTERWSFEALSRAAFDTRLLEADTAIRVLVDEWERLGAVEPERALALDSVVQALREWDRISTLESVPTTLFVLYAERLRASAAPDGPWQRVAILEEVLAELRSAWGTADVPWGEINRLQRIHTSGQREFDEFRPSVGVPGAPGWLGIVFAFSTRPGRDRRQRFGVSGHTWVSVVEFAPRVRAGSVVPFGQTADPNSPHWFDQAPLYSAGRFKQAWFWRDEVERNARRSYHPGRPDSIVIR